MLAFYLSSKTTYFFILGSTKTQTWALALYFQVRSPLSAHFLSMDRYRSIAHFANFQVAHRSIALKKTSGLLLEKSAKTLDRS